MEDFYGEAERRRQNAWPAGRVDLHWHVLFDPKVMDAALVQPYREVTHRPGLSAVDARWLHLTVLHAGPVDRYRAGEIDSVVARVREACGAIAPFDVTIDRPVVSRVAVECAVRPGAPMRRLWELTSCIDAEVTGSRFPQIPAGYYPHLALAYGVGGPVRADRLAMNIRLSDLPGEPVQLRAERLSLVAQSHDRQHITWERLADIELSGPGT